MFRLFALILLVTMGLLSACTKQGMYESIQIGSQEQCQSLHGAEFDRCMEQFEQDYESYRQDREAVLEHTSE